MATPLPTEQAPTLTEPAPGAGPSLGERAAPAPRRRRRVPIAASAFVLASSFLLGACSDEGEADAVTLGVADREASQWDVFEEQAEAAGLAVEITSFSGHDAPNDAVAQGDLDANQFQHLQYLATYNVGAGEELVPVGSTEIVPLAVYWQGHDSLDGIEGEEVAIPNDPANQARALNLLAQLDLVELSGDPLEPVPADVDEDASEVSIVAVDAAQTPVVYQEGRPAIITNNFLGRAGISPDEAVAEDDPEDPRAEPYINVVVTTADKADDPRLQQIVELWHTDEVQAAVAEESGGTSVPVRREPGELREILERLERQVADEG